MPFWSVELATMLKPSHALNCRPSFRVCSMSMKATAVRNGGARSDKPWPGHERHLYSLLPEVFEPHQSRQEIAKGQVTMLTDDEKREVREDYLQWSGGEPPLDICDVCTYVDCSYPFSWSVDDVISYSSRML